MELRNPLNDASQFQADAAYAWERDREEHARTLALLSIASSLLALVEQLHDISDRGADALRVEILNS